MANNWDVTVNENELQSSQKSLQKNSISFTNFYGAKSNLLSIKKLGRVNVLLNIMQQLKPLLIETPSLASCG